MASLKNRTRWSTVVPLGRPGRTVFETGACVGDARRARCSSVMPAPQPGGMPGYREGVGGVVAGGGEGGLDGGGGALGRGARGVRAHRGWPDWEAAGGAPKADPGDVRGGNERAAGRARGGVRAEGRWRGNIRDGHAWGVEGAGGSRPRPRPRPRRWGTPSREGARSRLLAAAPTTALARGLVRHPRSRVPRASERAIERPIVARVATRGGLCARSRSRPPVGPIARSTEVWNVIDDSELSLVVSPLALLSPFRLGTPTRGTPRGAWVAPRGVLALRDVALRDVPPTPRAGAARRFRDPRRGCRRAPPRRRGRARVRPSLRARRGASRPARRRRAVRARGGRPRARVVRVRRVRAMEIVPRRRARGRGPPTRSTRCWSESTSERSPRTSGAEPASSSPRGTSPLVVLEVGAGDGRLARHLTRAVRDMDAADPTVVSPTVVFFAVDDHSS